MHKDKMKLRMSEINQSYWNVQGRNCFSPLFHSYDGRYSDKGGISFSKYYA